MVKIFTFISIAPLLINFCLFTQTMYAAEKQTRPAAQADRFYPGNPDKLSEYLRVAFQSETVQPYDGNIIGIISPHAGYPYSGHVAANVYKHLERKKYTTVVVIAPSHTEAFEGATIYPGDSYETPLGVVPIQKDYAKQITKETDVVSLSAKGHGTEHALEVQLPFLQMMLQNFSLIPIVIGEQNFTVCQKLAQALAKVLPHDGVLLVASSDLSHYHSYKEAQELDKQIINAVSNYDYTKIYQGVLSQQCEACGMAPIITVMMAARFMGANDAYVTKFANSGDVPPGDKKQVVGYMSAILGQKTKTAAFLSPEEHKELLTIARTAIETKLRKGKTYTPSTSSPNLQRSNGAFVTLTAKGNLRGCIGHIMTNEPLFKTVKDAAISAAFSDPRFPQLSAKEYSTIQIEISVLGPLYCFQNVDDIEVGKHGLYIIYGNNSGLLLPQVATEYKWDRLTFLDETCRKAGLPQGAWKNPNATIFTFTAEVFGEEK